MSFKGKNHGQIQSKNLNTVSGPQFNALSNGALGFPLS
jgi:hypothetical protein